LDTKAKVKIGPFSRGGKSRGAAALQAADHDMGADAMLVPFGILEASRGIKEIGQLWLGFGQSRETSDFIADALHAWWCERQAVYADVRRLHIELDNGPEINSSRTQFMKRLVEFADASNLAIELVYFPPYHSKYNPIERCWGILEQHWDGSLLTSIDIALNWAGTMTWRGMQPMVRRLEGIYERGVRLTQSAFRPIAKRLIRSDNLPKWSVVINPTGW
jgi:Rhodopirellula transposase DDE domain